MEEEMESVQKELSETRRALEEVKKEYSGKCAEWRQAQHSLMADLMRKSMHVGSLAFAIEGQVKEKTRWFSCLSLVARNLEALKLQHLHVAAQASSAHQSLLPYLAALQSAVDRQSLLNSQLRTAALERKHLYNTLLDLKGTHFSLHQNLLNSEIWMTLV